MKPEASLLRRIPMTPKLLLITLLLGVVVWWILDYAQTKKVRALFEDSVVARLAQQDHDNRMRFNHYVDVFPQMAKLIVAQSFFADHAGRGVTASPGAQDPVRHTEIPPWLPDAAVMRKLARIHYALLLDTAGRVREVYEGWPEPMPQALVNPSTLLMRISRNQSFITSLEGRPFLITTAAAPVHDGPRRTEAILMLAVRMNDDFISASQGWASRGTIVVLAERDNPRVIASSMPDLIPFGVPLEDLKKKYLITSKSFFDWGSADLTVHFVSLIPRAEFEQLNASVIAAERLQRAILSFSFILVFGAIIYWITSHIQGLTKKVKDISVNTLRISPQEIPQGDQLFILDRQFENLSGEIVQAREKLAEDLLREKTVYLDNILHSSAQAIVATDLAYRVKYYNDVAERIFGYPARDVIGKTVNDIHRWENIDLSRIERVLDAIRDGGDHTYVVVREKEGRSLFIESKVSGIRDKDGLLIGFALLAQDVTARTQAERSLAVQYAVTSILAESATLGETTPKILQAVCEGVGWEIGELWLADADGPALRRCGAWNRPGEELDSFIARGSATDFSRDSGIPGKVWADGRPVLIADLDREPSCTRADAAAAAGLHGAFIFPVRNSGSLIGVMAFFSGASRRPDDDLLRMFDALGSQIGDFIKRKQSEDDLQRFSVRLEQSNRELDEFASVAAHDLQAPLRSVSGFAHLIEEQYKGRLDKEADEYIGYVMDGTLRMQQLINDLLDYSRVTTRGRPLQSTDCNLVLKEALQDLRTAVEESKAEITADPLPVVMGDEGQLVRLFQNLIGNAIKYQRNQETPRVHLSASPLGRSAGGGWLFSVRDNGIGIDPSQFKRIFQIFQRLHTRREYPGTGMGLTICKKIVERHGGEIWVESEPGKGSDFRFTIAESVDRSAPDENWETASPGG